MSEGTAKWIAASGRIDVWFVPLQVSAEVISECANLLSEDEHERAAAFHWDEPRARFIASRAALRVLLSRYIGVEPDEIRFTYGVFGKPMLRTGSRDRASLQFNVAHSGCWAAYAMSADALVGIDIERMRIIAHLDDLAIRVFSTAERERLSCVAEADRVQAFYQLWTAKEAYLKAIGAGLTLSLDRIELMRDGGGRLAIVNPDAALPDFWVADGLSPAPGYAAAVAAPSPHTVVRAVVELRALLNDRRVQETGLGEAYVNRN